MSWLTGLVFKPPTLGDMMKDAEDYVAGGFGGIPPFLIGAPLVSIGALLVGARYPLAQQITVPVAVGVPVGWWILLGFENSGIANGLAHAAQETKIIFSKRQLNNAFDVRSWATGRPSGYSCKQDSKYKKDPQFRKNCDMAGQVSQQAVRDQMNKNMGTHFK